jgi:carboxyl-terminal processing protease
MDLRFVRRLLQVRLTGCVCLFLVACNSVRKPESMLSAPDLLGDVWSIVLRNYYREDFGGVSWIEVAKQTADTLRQDLSEDELDQAIKDMLAVLNDKHTFYLSPDEVMKREAEGYEGVGFSTNEHPSEQGLNIVVRVLPGSPAELAGIRVGWLFLGEREGHYRFLDDYQRLQAYALEETYIPNNQLDRSARWLNEHSFYLRFDRFDEGVADWAAGHFQRLPPSARVIIDLRWNPGGRVVELSEIAGCVFPDATLLGIEKSRMQDSQFLRARKPMVLSGCFQGDLVVLISEYSASSSEILARAVQHYERGKVLGTEKSAGQVLISPSWKLANGGLLYVSTKDFLDPDGKRLQDVGVTPDILVERSTFFNLRKAQDPLLDKAIEVLN